ncbi:MAG: tetratricopeptide repeat protein [Kiritimatiellae bacterium]|nr:tetratricopeptide repeat protein [Kiritimatiellia bacterium]
MRFDHKWQAMSAVAVLTAAVTVLFLPTVGYDFAFYDDNYQVLENPLIRDLGPSGLARMFSGFSLTSYYPMRLLSFAVDYRLWGLKPAGYHLTNVLIHVLNSILVYLLCLRLQKAGQSRTDGELEPARRRGKGGSIVATRFVWAMAFALLFGVHPVAVEPVAWIGGREELLMLCFLLCSVHLQVRAMELEGDAPRDSGRRRAVLRVLAVFAAALACLSNVLGAIAPFLAVALELCLGGREGLPSCKRALRVAGRTWAYWLLAAAAIVLKKIGATLDVHHEVVDRVAMTVPQRVLTAVGLYGLNLRTLGWPAHLAVMYPKRVVESALTPGVAGGLAAAALTVWAGWLGRRNRLFLLGLCWFLVSLAPSAQLIPHHILRADRFLYLPLVGAVLALRFGLERVRRLRGYGGVAGLCLLGCAGLLWVRSALHRPIWRDSVKLFRHELAADNDNLVAHYNLANLLARDGRREEAARHYAEAVRIRPDFATGYSKLAAVLTELGRLDEAMRHYSAAIALRTDDADLYNNFGAALAAKGDVAAALGHYSTALRLNPEHKSAHCNLGVALDAMGQPFDAAAQYVEALRIDPEYADAHNNLAIILARQGRAADAIRHYSAALQTKPDYPDAHYNIGVVLLELGRRDEAVAHFSEALGLKTPFPQAERALRMAIGGEDASGAAVR